MRLLCTILAICFALTWQTEAQAQSMPKEVERELGAPNLQGKHTARFWGFRLFDAELWTKTASAFSFEQPFALTINYLYPFTREVLARSSVEEIARVEGGSPEDHAGLEKQLMACLVDVDKGTRITGVAETSNRAVMYVNGRKSCTLNYPNLRKRFFGIWLAPTSRDAKGAMRLRGNS